MRNRRDVTIKGEPGEMLLGAFSDVTVRQAPGVTVLSAELDQAALHGLLARLADLRLELMGVSLQAESGQPRGERPAMTSKVHRAVAAIVGRKERRR